MKFFAAVPFVLCSLLAPDQGAPAGGGTPEPAPTPTPEPAPAPAPAPETTEVAAAPVKLNVFQKAAGMLKDKAELLSIISGHEGTIAKLTAERDDFKNKFEAADTKAKGYESQIAEFEKTVNGLTAEKKTVEVAAADKIAALGFPENKLPEVSHSEGSEVPKSIEEFQKTHGEMSQKDPTAASKFYTAHAWRFGLENKPSAAK